jgi:hypothetical protein
LVTQAVELGHAWFADAAGAAVAKPRIEKFLDDAQAVVGNE